MRKYNFDKFFLYMAVLSLPIVIFFSINVKHPNHLFYFFNKKEGRLIVPVWREEEIE